MNTFIINMSGVYEEEGFSPEGSIVLNCRDMEETVCYCSEAATKELRRKLKDVPAEAIHWIDSGDFHYLSLLMLEKIKEPFILYLIDNHPDDQEPDFPGMLSCGSWVAEARKLPFCRAVVGPFRDNSLDVEARVHTEQDPAKDEQVLPAYISIDKDAMTRDFARTDWSQGTMDFIGLKSLLKEIASHHRIIGTDICGELTLSKGATADDIATNLGTNEAIQNLLESIFYT